MVGRPFFSEPYLGYACTSLPKTSPAMVAMTLLVVTEPKPPTEWPRIEKPPRGPQVGVFRRLQRQGVVDADAEVLRAVVDHVVEGGDDVAGPHVAAAQAGRRRCRSSGTRSIRSWPFWPVTASQKAALISRVRWLPVVESGSSIRSNTVNAVQSFRASTIGRPGTAGTRRRSGSRRRSP